ncbi:MAG: acetyltransferase-like isoleucine patch superfamily enzyme [Chitinophagales bacterium]|jgi:acetyltransferase-like isoleucine patch superfamily enzyme
MKLLRIVRYLLTHYFYQPFRFAGNVHPPLFVKGDKYIELGLCFNGGNNLRFECIDRYLEFCYSPKLMIGNNVSMNNNVHIGVILEVTIGDNCLFGSNILITDHSHGDPHNLKPIQRVYKKLDLHSSGPVRIGSNVWLGDNVSILDNTCIGDNSIVGANSVVKGYFPANSIIVGVPGKVVRRIE